MYFARLWGVRDYMQRGPKMTLRICQLLAGGQMWPDARLTQSRERFLGISACTFGTCITTFLSTMKSISFLAHSVSESKEHDHSWSSSWRRAIFAREMDNKFVSFLRRSVGRDGIHGKSISTVCSPPLSSHCDINGSSMRRRRR